MSSIQAVAVNLTQSSLFPSQAASNVLAGYDMIVQITEAEINSQFARLFGTLINPEIKANGLSTAGFGGKTLKLSSYLRGYINAPEVALATQEQPLQTLFYFSFQPQKITAETLKVTQATLDAAFASSPDGTNALLTVPEDIAYKDDSGNTQTLAKQHVSYWLTRTQTRIGSISDNQYTLVPSLMYYDSGVTANVMVSLATLKLSFQVLLDKVPTTAAQIEAQVAKGTAPQELLNTINYKGFDSSAFSLEQLFLNFDTTDFTQWQLTDPAGGLGATVNVLSLDGSGSFTSTSGPLSTFTGSDPQFSTELSSALQYAFGFGGKNTQGASPYIVGVTVSSNNPAQTDSMQPPSLVPTYISYSTTPSATSGLAALTYEVMGGTDGSARVPKHNDGTPINVTTNTATNNNFSGALLYAASVYFNPLILQPLQANINSSCNNTALNWTQSGMTWTASYNTTLHVQHMEVPEVVVVVPVTVVGDVYEDHNNSYTITVAGGMVTLTANTSVTVRIETYYDVFSGKIWSKWSKAGTLNWSIELDLGVDKDSNLQASQSGIIPPPTIGATVEDTGAKIQDVFSDIFSKLSGGHFDNMDKTMSNISDQITGELTSTANALGQQITRATRTKFISPTGTVFLINNPRFNAECDLEMDITYSV